MGTVSPLINCLTRDQCARVHGYSLKILSDVGVRVDSNAARTRFAQGDCRVLPDNRVFIPPERVQWAIQSAPDSVDIYDRNGNPAFTVGRHPQNQTRFGIGVTNLHYQDPATDGIAPFSIAHAATAAQLAQRLNQFDMLSTPGIAQDISQQTADLHTTLAMAANTTKPLVVLVSEHSRFGPVLDLLEHISGRLTEQPFAIPYVNPISPLVLNNETTEKMMMAIDRGLPFIFNNYGMSGATTPITPGGTLALLNAELLAGLVFAQLVKPGSPVILGSLPAGFDMKSMMSLYTPHTMLLNLACAEMMAYYSLPHSGTSGSGPGWGPDLLAAGGFWMNHFSSLLGKVGLAPFVGGNFDSMVFSPAAVVYADEVIRLSRMFADGFELDDAAVAHDEIRSIGPGGNFLMSGLTCRLFRQMPYESPIWPSMTLDQWLAKGSTCADETLRKHVLQVIDGLEPPGDHDELMDRGRRFIDTIR
ncbi:MAG: trimethylamine methyltransferase family protein [Deltaproteobacteria bacterium]|nr:trimethylamine methyltransferase family protein [Deltaproteobacteria bacterium]